MNCIICCEEVKKFIRCEYCVFEACLSCVKRYILSQAKACCMNTECLGEWSIVFMKKKMTNNWLENEYKNHIREVLYNKSLSHIPIAMDQISEEKRIELVNRSIAKLSSERQAIYKEICIKLIDLNI